MTYIGGQVGRGGTENFVLQLLVRWEAWSPDGEARFIT